MSTQPRVAGRFTRWCVQSHNTHDFRSRGSVNSIPRVIHTWLTFIGERLCRVKNTSRRLKPQECGEGLWEFNNVADLWPKRTNGCHGSNVPMHLYVAELINTYSIMFLVIIQIIVQTKITQNENLTMLCNQCVIIHIHRY